MVQDTWESFRAFDLVVDDFSVKHTNLENAFNLLACFSQLLYLEVAERYIHRRTHNLYAGYAIVMVDMVLASNKWYYTWPEGATWQDNLNYTHQFFELDVSQELAEKVNELYMD
jgi:hypothetical protein